MQPKTHACFLCFMRRWIFCDFLTLSWFHFVSTCVYMYIFHIENWNVCFKLGAENIPQIGVKDCRAEGRAVERRRAVACLPGCAKSVPWRSRILTHNLDARTRRDGGGGNGHRPVQSIRGPASATRPRKRENSTHTIYSHRTRSRDIFTNFRNRQKQVFRI